MTDDIRVRTKHAELTLEEIATSLPGTGEVMRSVGHCFAMTWHACRGGNWDLGTYYQRRWRNLLLGLALTRPKYAARMKAFDRDFAEPLYQASLGHDSALFAELYERATAEANRYHVDTGHAYIRWSKPDQPPDTGLDLSGL